MVPRLVQRGLLWLLSRTKSARARQRQPSSLARRRVAPPGQGHAHRGALEYSAGVQIRRLWFPSRAILDDLRLQSRLTPTKVYRDLRSASRTSGPDGPQRACWEVTATAQAASPNFPQRDLWGVREIRLVRSAHLIKRCAALYVSDERQPSGKSKGQKFPLGDFSPFRMDFRQILPPSPPVSALLLVPPRGKLLFGLVCELHCI